MSTVIFASGFAIVIGLAVYLSVSEKMHAKPWKLLGLAFIAIIFNFWFQAAIDISVSLLDTVEPGKPHLTDMKLIVSLINTMIGALAGALIGTAISNRALHMNAKAVDALRDREALNKEKLTHRAKIKEELEDEGVMLSREDFWKKHKLCELLLTDYLDKLDEIREEEKKLLP